MRAVFIQQGFYYISAEKKKSECFSGARFHQRCVLKNQHKYSIFSIGIKISVRVEKNQG
jgi:hypothetical protein